MEPEAIIKPCRVIPLLILKLTMAVANIPWQTSLPTRSRTHPMWTSKQSGQNSKHLERFDPHELYRRLEKYKEEQARAHERRKAKVVNHKTPQEYQHVPQYAAADFVNTASRDWLENQTVHPLARHVSQSLRNNKSHHLKDGYTSHYVEQQDLASQKVKATADRNQFQRTQILQNAAESDENRGIFRPPQRDFESLFVLKKQRGKIADGIGPPGVAELDLIDEEPDHPVVSKSQLNYRPDDRHDWAQRDECAGHERHGFRNHILPVLRKTHIFGDSKGQSVDRPVRQKRLSLRFLSFSG